MTKERSDRLCDGRKRNGNHGFHDNRLRRKPFRFSPPGLSVFSGLEKYLRVVSSAESLGRRFLASLSFFGVLTMEEITFQPVACDMECECEGGTFGTSGVGANMGTRDGDGAVDGRLRIGRRNFGEVLTLGSFSGVLGTT